MPKTIFGTSYFVSLDKAAMYYRDIFGKDGFKAAQRKVAEGEIHIGKPELKKGQKLTVIDNHTRYAIIED